MRHVVPIFFAVSLCACADSHSHHPDADAAHDGGGDLGCARDVGPVAPPFWCVRGAFHLCDSDLPHAPICGADGEWECPYGTMRESEVDCWCVVPPPSMDCSCTERGWSCPPAPECPTDLASADGMPCSEEGRSCGRCTDSCGFCNILRCEGGRWTRLEAHPVPPPCTSFECGPELRCAAEFQYCEHTVSDIAGAPDEHACRPLPDDCSECECLPEGGTCERGSEGGLTLTLGGA